MTHVCRSPLVLVALLVPLIALASAARADSHAPAASAEATPKAQPETPEPSGVLTEGGVVDDEVAGGRDISEKRAPKLVWSEMVEIRDKMSEVADDRDMRALVLSPQEQGLFVAFAKRMFDLSKELDALTRPSLGDADRVRLHRSMQQFRAALGEVRAIAGGLIHRGLPSALDRMSKQMKGIWLRFPDAEKVLGPEGLPPSEELNRPRL